MNITRLATAVISFVAITLSGCASHTWAPPPGKTTADFERQKAQCNIFARNGGQGFAASGSTSFVAGAAVGNAMGNAVKFQADFNDCMAANGWTVADQTPERVAAQKVTANANKVTQDNIKAVIDQRRQCVADLHAQTQYAPILVHLPDLNTHKFSITQMADDSYPSPEEASVLGKYADADIQCRDTALASLAPLVSASFIQTIKDSEVLNDQATVAVVKRAITWGDWASRVKGNNDDLNAKLKSIGR